MKTDLEKLQQQVNDLAARFRTEVCEHEETKRSCSCLIRELQDKNTELRKHLEEERVRIGQVVRLELQLKEAHEKIRELTAQGTNA
jgi:hypothetical protein